MHSRVSAYIQESLTFLISFVISPDKLAKYSTLWLIFMTWSACAYIQYRHLPTTTCWQIFMFSMLVWQIHESKALLSNLRCMLETHHCILSCNLPVVAYLLTHFETSVCRSKVIVIQSAIARFGFSAIVCETHL